MDKIYTRDQLVLMSMCDYSGRLAVADTVGLFMQSAAEATELLGIGFTAMEEKHFFWLTVRTRCRIHRRPKVLARVTLSTWAHAMQRAACNRYYTLSDDRGLLAEGKTEWIVFDTDTMAVSTELDEVFYKFPPCEDTVCDGQKARVGRAFADNELLGRYTVRSTDIDIGHHMNNVAYIRAIMSLIPTAEQTRLDIREFEISYHSPCLEGEELSIYRRETETGFEAGIFRPDGTLSSTARFWTGNGEG